MPTETFPLDHQIILKILPRVLHDAPLTVQHDWLLSKARQYSTLSIATMIFGCIFFLLFILAVTDPKGIRIAELSVSFPVLAIAIWTVTALIRARGRCLLAAKSINVTETES